VHPDPACQPSEDSVSVVQGHGGSFFLESELGMEWKIFRHLAKAELNQQFSPQSFVLNLLKNMRQERRKCNKMNSETVYCKNLEMKVFSKPLFKYLNDLI